MAAFITRYDGSIAAHADVTHFLPRAWEVSRDRKLMTGGLSATNDSGLHSRAPGDRESLEVTLLLEAVFQAYGYDFRRYAYSSIKRRIWNVVRTEGLENITSLQERLLHDIACMERFLLAISVNVTSMYRDPAFFRVLRTKIAPLLRTYPFVRIWHAGCSTGEEVYSLSILLQEEGLYDRCRIYATDMNESVLHHAKEGIFDLKAVESYHANYAAAGGKHSLTDHYTSAYGSAIFRGSLRDNVVFSLHNLAMDSSFNEFNLILCRNVMIYFDRSLQQQVHKLLYQSLSVFGVLGIGSKESLHSTPHEHHYEVIDRANKLYRRVVGEI